MQAQQESDTSKVKDDWEWEWDADSDSTWDWENFDDRVIDYTFRGAPTITLNYGLSKMSIDKFKDDFADPNLIEVKLGYTTQHLSKKCDDIVKYNYRYLFLSNISTDLANVSESNPKLETNMWRFGLGRSSGYGYQVGQSAIIPYYTYSFEWSRIDFKETPADSVDRAKTNLYHESFRFGTSAEGGIRINIIPQITIEAGYERSAVFQRHLFWKWAGSALLEAAGQWGIDSFVREIMKSTPMAVPVVNFLLKNALSYGVYELRKEKMNWPFKSEAPVSYDQFKFGLTFTL
jgi:hypothetical protein